MRNLTAMWTCSLFLSLVVESDQKLKVHWSPQSMMYLKGKHGRRFVSDDDSGGFQDLRGLQGWYGVLKGLQRLQSRLSSRPPHILSS